LCPPLVVVPIEGWNKVTQKALRFALTLSSEIVAVEVRDCENDDELKQRWPLLVERPTREAGLPVPSLITLKSPYRAMVEPIIDYILELESKLGNRHIAVVLPQLVERHWYEYFLHKQYGELLSALLLLKSDRRITIVNVPWHLRS